VLVDWSAGLLVDRSSRLAQVIVIGVPEADRPLAPRIAGFTWDVESAGLTAPELPARLGLERSAEPTSFESFLARIHPADRPLVAETVRRAIAERMTFRLAIRTVQPDGEIRHNIVWGDAEVDASGAPRRVLGSCQDVTEVRRAQETRRAYELATRDAAAQLFRAATHDPATGLPNRRLLMDRLEQAVARTLHGAPPFALVFIDVDRFQLVNHSLGPHAGDEAVRVIAERIRAAIRPGDTIARIGGDEFVVMTDGLADAEAAVALAARVLDSISRPVVIAGRKLILTASVGITLAAGEGEAAASLIRDGTAAMTRAKEHGGNRIELFERGMAAGALATLEVEQALRRALSMRDLQVVYQPIVRLDDGQPVMLEALARLQTPSGGLLLPAEFIPVAERTGLSPELSRQVLLRACRDAVRFMQARPGAPLTVAVNLSASEFSQVGLIERVVEALTASSLDPAHLCIEMTESAVIPGPAEAADALAWLQNAGVALALDDFGTGYSSISHLRRMPVDIVKVDRSFVADLATEREDQATIDAIVGLAHAFGAPVVAEGVETPEQLEILRFLGADFAQGYLFARPIPADDIPALLEALASR
jgi:diguanylate cyclase (GGDEF)-like protein